MSRKRGGSREVRNVAFPVVNCNGPDQLVHVYCKASLDKRGNPIIPTGPDEVIWRYRGLELEHDPLVTFFDTNPRIGSEIFVGGNSLDLAFVIVDRMARYGFSETRIIIATGCLRGNDGVVEAVDDFERKLALLVKSGLRDFLFIFPKRNFAESIRHTFQYLKEERGAECRAVEKLDEVRFLWTDVEPARRLKWRWMRWLGAGILALAAAIYVEELAIAPSPTALLSPSSPTPDKSIYTSGENGAYHTKFCPPLPGALATVYLFGYQCVPSSGTVDNIQRVLTYPTSIGLVQLDVYANEAIKRSDEFKRLRVVRSDIACEGLWMVTKNFDLKSYDQVRANASRIPFILPSKSSGPAASFVFLQERDPDGLGRAREANTRYVSDGTAVLNETASSTNGAVGFIVQFADPENTNIRLMVEKGLNVIPMASSNVLNIRQPGGQPVYQEKTFTLKSGGTFDIFDIFATRVTTACTPVAMITGEPAAFSGDQGKRDQMDLIRKIVEVPAAILVPQKSRVVEIIVYCKALVTQVIAEAGALAERMRRMIENRCCSVH